MDIPTISYMGIEIGLQNIALIVAAILGIIILFTSSRFKVMRWNFFNTPYKHIEIEHDGMIRDNYYIQDSDIKNGKYIDGWGREFNLSEIFNPTHVRSNCIRYTFKNESVLPYLNMDSNAHTIKAVNRYEIMTKTKDGKQFIITNLFIKNLLDEHFVEKIKKEAKTGWEAILEFLKTPSGAIICVALIGLIAFALMMNR